MIPERFVELDDPSFAKCIGLQPPRGIWCHISGIDLVRGGDGYRLTCLVTNHRKITAQQVVLTVRLVTNHDEVVATNPLVQLSDLRPGTRREINVKMPRPTRDQQVTGAAQTTLVRWQDLQPVLSSPYGLVDRLIRLAVRGRARSVAHGLRPRDRPGASPRAGCTCPAPSISPDASCDKATDRSARRWASVS